MTEPPFDHFKSADEIRRLLGYHVPIEMEVVRVPNAFRIRWWQFGMRYRLWRQERRLVNLVQRKKIEEMNAALENQAIYGDGPWNPRS